MAARGTLGRLTAAVGVVTGFLGIWLDAISGAQIGISYWNLDGTLAALLLTLSIGCALLCLAALLRPAGGIDLSLVAAGATLFGLYLFFPAAFAFSSWEALGSGAWLGVCTGLVVGGAAAAAVQVAPGLGVDRRGREIDLVPAAVAVLGLVLVLVAIWLRFDKSGGSYWHPEAAGHGLGVLFLILIGTWSLVALIAVVRRSNAALMLVLVPAFTAFGLAFLAVAISAFKDLGALRAGAWLAFAGGVLLAGGTAAVVRHAFRPTGSPPPVAGEPYAPASSLEA